MIQDLVDAARIEAGQLKVNARPVDIRALILDLKQRMAATGGERVVVEAPEGLPAVLADPDRLERVLMNLLSNALKFSTEGTAITVIAAKHADEVVTTVSDRGRGIPPDEQLHLFERYYRTKESRKRPEGLGLGLFITKELVEAQGGRIWVESEVDKGSSFYFTLPLAKT